MIHADKNVCWVGVPRSFSSWNSRIRLSIQLQGCFFGHTSGTRVIVTVDLQHNVCCAQSRVLIKRGKKLLKYVVLVKGES